MDFFLTMASFISGVVNPFFTVIPLVPQKPFVKLYLSSVTTASSPTIASVVDLNSPPRIYTVYPLSEILLALVKEFVTKTTFFAVI